MRTQPISMNLPDESDELRPVREYLPERVPGAPTVVSSTRCFFFFVARLTENFDLHMIASSF